jgi:hypothetical protein
MKVAPLHPTGTQKHQAKAKAQKHHKIQLTIYIIVHYLQQVCG